MKRDQAFPSKYLKPAELTGPLTLTIDGVEYETMKNFSGKEVLKPVMSFRKFKKLLIINATNFDAVCDITGQPNSDDWGGHQIEIYPSEAQVGSEMKPCIRVRGPEQATLKAGTATKRPIKKAAPPKANGDDDMDDQIPY